MTESNRQEKPDSWTPEKLIRHKVVVGFDLDYSVARIHINHGEEVVNIGAGIGETDVDFVRRVYAEATRIAKERE